MVAGIVLIGLSCGSAYAGSLPDEGWDVPIVMHASDYDMGTVWRNLDGSPASPGVYDDPHNQLMRIAPSGFDYGEDTWGIVQIDNIWKGFILTDHTSIKLLPSTPDLWSIGDDNMELWGVFYGHRDTKVIVNPDGSQISYGSGIQFDIWAQPMGTFAGVHGPAVNKQFGSADRLAQDRYAGIGFDAGGNAVVGAQLWMSMAGVAGFISAQPAASFNGTYYPEGIPGQGNDAGGAKLWGEFDDPAPGDVAGVDYGTANATYDQDWYHSGFTNDVADIRLQIDTELNTGYTSDFDWLVTSSDPLQTWAPHVPEPATMVLLAIGGLSILCKRSRKTDAAS